MFWGSYYDTPCGTCINLTIVEGKVTITATGIPAMVGGDTLHWLVSELQCKESYGTGATWQRDPTIRILPGAHASPRRLLSPKMSMFWSLYYNQDIIESQRG